MLHRTREGEEAPGIRDLPIDRVLVKNQSAGLAVSSSVADIVRFSQQSGSLT